MSFAWRLRKKILKRWARNAFFPAWRVTLLRSCGFTIGRDVYIADDLLIVEELAERGNITIGDRVSIAPRVTLVTSSHPNHSRIRGFAPVSQGPIVIEEDAWLGAGCVVLPRRAHRAWGSGRRQQRRALRCAVAARRRRPAGPNRPGAGPRSGVAVILVDVRG